MVRSVGAVGTFVLGLHKKREKVHHPGLQHVNDNKRHLHARAFFDAHMCDVDHGA